MFPLLLRPDPELRYELKFTPLDCPPEDFETYLELADTDSSRK